MMPFQTHAPVDYATTYSEYFDVTYGNLLTNPLLTSTGAMSRRTRRGRNATVLADGVSLEGVILREFAPEMGTYMNKLS